MPADGRFSRTEALIGKQALGRLKASSVAVFGIGGVGSFAVEALARAGVGKLVLIDNDIVQESNINRQVHALGSTVGMFKTDAMKQRIMDINPDAAVETLRVFYLPGEPGVDWRYDYVIDAVDTVTAKLDIIVEAKKRGVPVISAMGAGNKLDPARFEVADIYSTSVCPLAKVMRHELRKRGVESLKVVYSKEPPVAQGLADCRDDAGTMGRRASVRPITASISFVPSAMGLIIAGEVVKDLII